MRYRLRTLLFLLTLLPPMVGWAWFNVANGFEFVGWLTMLGIFLMAYWSLGFWLSGKHPAFTPPSDK